MTAGTVVETDSSTACKLHYKKIHAAVDLSSISQVFAGRRSASILGGNVSIKDSGGFSYWAAEPKELFEFRSGQKDPFEKLHKALTKYNLEPDAVRNTQYAGTRLPRGIFCGGWVGYFSYELGRYIEKLPESVARPSWPWYHGLEARDTDLQMPLIRLCFYDRLIAYDHKQNKFWLFAVEFPDDDEEPQDKFAGLEEILAQARGICISHPKTADFENIDFSQTCLPTGKIRCNMDKEYYLRMVERIKRYIYDGDVYQINFSQRFECDYNAKAIDLFNWQNHYNPSPYAAYIDGGDFYIVSASPEMFITIIDGIIETRPIKGTRPHIENDARANEENFNELLTSEKEKAELNMIIDLERNDVARICIPGTRRVIQPRTIETYPTVFHAVATVAGRLRSEITFCDILKAMFPGGSITGAPKIRSMEIIDETEPTARGVYTGSIGYIGLDGSVCLNIAIRTIIIKNQKAFAQTGGGIVADSDPQAEWDETITKARALLAGINATNSVKRLA